LVFEAGFHCYSAKDEARRIAANIAKLPELLQRARPDRLICIKKQTDRRRLYQRTLETDQGPIRQCQKWPQYAQSGTLTLGQYNNKAFAGRLFELTQTRLPDVPFILGVEKKVINESTRIKLLGNVLVLIATKDSKIDHVDIEPGFDLAKLADDGRIATGDVEAIPVGLYAKAALEKLGVWPSVESKMAMTVNVRAALASVARRQAQLSIVYATDAKIEPGVKVVGVFPNNSHDPITYPVAATVNAKPGTIQYLAFLRSAAAKSIFEGYSFSVLAKPTS
jgi:molybdate transport system substrate-binding protein